MIAEDFTLSEAMKLVGRVYEARQDFLSIRKGTKARVVSASIEVTFPVIVFEWEDQNGALQTLPLPKGLVNQYFHPVETEQTSAPQDFTDAEARGLVGMLFENVVDTFPSSEIDAEGEKNLESDVALTSVTLEHVQRADFCLGARRE